ncbi:MAG: hypothetical protein IJ086_14090 [Clostridium sp.]|nr:hypothetical protein [Clostridium sp.]
MMISKEEFNSLEVLEQIKYINDNIGYVSLTLFCNRLGVNRTTITKRFKKLGYVFNKSLSKFILDENKEDIEPKEENQKPLKSNLEPQIRDINKVDIISMLHRITELEKRVNELENKANTEENKSIQNEYKSIQKDNIRFYPKNNDTTKTFRVDINVYNKFKDFCDKHNHYKQKDLISSALELYLEGFEDN